MGSGPSGNYTYNECDVRWMNADGIDNVNGSYMLVEDNYIHDIATTGVYFKGGSVGSIAQRNAIGL